MRKIARGLWRRTTIGGNQKPQPTLDSNTTSNEASTSEKKNWVLERLMPTAYSRAMTVLPGSFSPVGADATQSPFREFDL